MTIEENNSSLGRGVGTMSPVSDPRPDLRMPPVKTAEASSAATQRIQAEMKRRGEMPSSEIVKMRDDLRDQLDAARSKRQRLNSEKTVRIEMIEEKRDEVVGNAQREIDHLQKQVAALHDRISLANSKSAQAIESTTEEFTSELITQDRIVRSLGNMLADLAEPIASRHTVE